MLSFPLSSKEIRVEDYAKVEDLKPGVVSIMRNRKTNEKIVFDQRNENTKRQDFIQLLQKIYNLHHPSILHLYGFITSPHRIIATNYMKNGSLEEIFKAKKNFAKLSSTARRMIVFGIATVFEYLHQQEVLLSPFDPSDIILNDDFQPLVKLCSICQETKKSLRIFPPEYLKEGVYSEKTDVFTFGVILFQLATELKFQSVENINPLSLHNVTPLAKDIILKCVSKDPNARPYFKNIVNDLLNSDDTLFLKESKREIEEFITQNLEFQQINDFDLSKKYKEGNELPQDLAMSAFLMKRAADENKMNAQFSYGKMLLNGTGVKENREEARKYFEKAAKAGYEKARQQLSNLERREKFEKPIITLDKLLDLTSSTHYSTVKYISDCDSEQQDAAAHIIVNLLAIRPMMIPKYVRLVNDIYSHTRVFIDKVMDCIFSNLSPFSISFLYQLYLKKTIDIVSYLSASQKYFEDKDIITLILSYFGPEIKENNPERFYDLVQASNFNCNIKQIRERRAEKHPNSNILQAVRRDNPSSLKVFKPEDFNVTICKDLYDPISYLLVGQTAADYAAFIGSYHIFSKLNIVLTPSLIKNAVCGGSIEILKTLKKLNANFKNSLKVAILYHQQKVFDWILTNNLDSLTADLILFAAMANNSHFLLDYKCDPHVKDIEGNNSIHLAAKNGSVDFLRILLALNEDLDINERNNDGKTPLDIAEDNEQEIIIDFLQDYDSLNDSYQTGQSPFQTYANFSNNFFDPISPSKHAGNVSDDDFITLEKKVNEENFSSDEKSSSNIESFDIEFERKNIPAAASRNKSKSPPKINFSSDSESYSSQSNYLLNYLKQILNENLFMEIRDLQQKGTFFKQIEVPFKVQRPFHISSDFSDLIIDVINEMVEADHLYEYTYDQYIEKLFKTFDTKEEFKEQSNKEISGQYQQIFEDNQLSLLFYISDNVLKKQLTNIIGVKEPLVSDLETIVIDSNFEDTRPRKDRKRLNIGVKLENSNEVRSHQDLPLSPLANISVDSASDIFKNDDDSDLLENSGFIFNGDNKNNKYSFFNEDIKAEIKDVLKEPIFKKIQQCQAENKRLPLPTTKSSPLISFIKKMIDKDNLPVFTYNSYVDHLAIAYQDEQNDSINSGSGIMGSSGGYSEESF